MSIQVVCAWCQKDLGKKEGKTLHAVSHGICPDCARKVMDEIRQRKNQSEEGDPHKSASVFF